MYGLMLQDWTTIQGGSVNIVTQAEADWLDLSRFQDVFFFIEVRALTKAGATNILLYVETAPTKDPMTFQNMAFVNLATGTSPIYVPILASQASGGAAGLTRWVRWTLLPSGGTLSGNWSTTFRVTCAANSILGG
jgi:hypothetical protein